MFRFNVEDVVYCVVGNDIKMGMVLGRKWTEAPAYKQPMHELRDKMQEFNQPGNKLGRSCTRYEIRWLEESGHKTSVVEEDKLFASPWDISEHFTTLAEKLDEHKAFQEEMRQQSQWDGEES